MGTFKRISKDDIGSGGGFAVFSSELFTVVHWKFTKGMEDPRLITEVRASILHPVNGIFLDGHDEFKSDEDCIKLLTAEEFSQCLAISFGHGYSKGKETMRFDIRELLGLEDKYSIT